MSDLVELLPCPFCGADAKRHDIECLEDIDNAGGSYIECTGCGACTQLHFDRKENLLDSWNRRVGVAEQSGAGAPESAVPWPALVKRPVAFRIPRAEADGDRLSATEFRYFADEAQANAEAEALGIEYQGLYARDGS